MTNNSVLKKISIVVPCYNEHECIPIFLKEVLCVASTMPINTEITFIDDGSTDNTLHVLRELTRNSKQVRYIALSRNFGKEAAILAGLEAAQGDYVVVMDADLQHPPHLLPLMLEGIVNENFDSVAAKRSNRNGESCVRSFFARIFYRMINKVSDTEMVEGATDYRLMTRQVVDAVLSLKEYNRFSKGIFSWVGFSTKWLEFENVQRQAGKTKWSFGGLILYSIDGIVSFSIKPLAVSSFFGLLFCLISFLGTIFIVIRWLMFGDPVQGWASTICIILFVGGIQLFSTGILGQYLAKSYLETKGRPIYVIKEKS